MPDAFSGLRWPKEGLGTRPTSNFMHMHHCVVARLRGARESSPWGFRRCETVCRIKSNAGSLVLQHSWSGTLADEARRRCCDVMARRCDEGCSAGPNEASEELEQCQKKY